MPKNLHLNERRISFKTKRLVKADKIKIIKSKGSIYIEALPKSYHNNISINEINELYVSFIELGRTLYNLNKDNNISKISISQHSININPANKEYILNNNPEEYIKIEVSRHINNWIKDSKLNIDDITPIPSYILLNTTNWNYDKKLTNWLKNNFVPYIDNVDPIDSSKANQWIYSDNGKLIDMAIFFYLVTYAIINVKNKYNGKINHKLDNIKFTDFIDIDILPKSDPLCLNILNDIIYYFELNNIYSLYGYNSLKFDYETGKYQVERQYNDIYGLLWNIFKLFISDNYSMKDSEDSKLPISICIDCGNPILGNKLRCTDCEYDNVRIRKAKSRKALLNNVDKIKELINTNKYPEYIIQKANAYLNMTKTELLQCKKSDIDDLLNELISYNKKS